MAGGRCQVEKNSQMIFIKDQGENAMKALFFTIINIFIAASEPSFLSPT